MHHWLERFAYRIGPDIWTFAYCSEGWSRLTAEGLGVPSQAH